MENNQELCANKHKYINDKLEDHEGRIRELEKNSTEQRILSMEIQKTQVELKNLILENDRRSIERNDKSNEKMDKVLDTVLDVFKNKEESKTSIKVNNNKQVWLTIGAIITAISGMIVALIR